MSTKLKKRMSLIVKVVTAVILSFCCAGCYENGYDSDKDPFYMGTQQMKQNNINSGSEDITPEMLSDKS